MLIVTSALGFARFGYAMILPAMQEDLNLTNTQMGLLASGNLSGYLLFTLFAGFFTTKYGHRKIIISSMFLVSGALFLTGLTKSFTPALAARTLTGIGSGGANVPTMSLAPAWFNEKSRGKAAGVMAAGSGVGLILTGFLVPIILSIYGITGWRYAWAILGIISLFIAVNSYIFVKSKPSQKKESSTVEKAFLFQWKNIYRNRSIIHLGVIYFTFGFSYIIYTTFFAAYLEKEVGLTPLTVGQLWILMGCLSIFSGFIWGAVSDRIGRKYGLAVVFLLSTLSFIIFAYTKNIVWIYASIIIFGLVAWAVPTIMAAATGDYLGYKLAPATLAFITTFFFGTGQALAPYIAGYIKDAVGFFAPAFMLSAYTSIIGLILSLLLKKTQLITQL